MELTIVRPCSGKHVIAVIGCVKAARWRLCDEKGVRIATVSDYGRQDRQVALSDG